MTTSRPASALSQPLVVAARAAWGSRADHADDLVLLHCAPPDQHIRLGALQSPARGAAAPPPRIVWQKTRAPAHAGDRPNAREHVQLL